MVGRGGVTVGRAVGKQELFVLPVCVPQGGRPAQGRRLAVASSGQLLPHGFCRDPIFVRQSMRGCSARLSDLMQSPLLEAIMLPSARAEQDRTEVVSWRVKVCVCNDSCPAPSSGASERAHLPAFQQQWWRLTASTRWRSEARFHRGTLS